jgi:Carboxypeptidase regulatory-like domain
MKLACFLLLIAFSTVSFAQSNYATLVGTVYDPQNRPLPGVTVQITSADTQAIRKVVSNEFGIYRVTGLLPGDYELEVTVTGFAVHEAVPASRGRSTVDARRQPEAGLRHHHY